MRIHITPMIAEPEPSPRPELTLLIILVITAALTAAGVAWAGRAL